MMPRTFGKRLEPQQARRAANPRQINILRKNDQRMTALRQIVYSLASYSAI
ncbi:hypothetical protein [Massilia sp. Root418]|uniref:hypothetical protein n=1 Tax=Massilia sp. Root418 TaxID=1736532 RepID=UPI0012F66747|nr:hypothetical protein [Massilia sp. Root418]